MEENTTTEAQATNEGSTETTEPGGDNPTVAYANGKFTNVGDLESSYLELQSTFSKKMGAFEGAPEEYSFGEDFEANDTSDILTQWGKDNALSNDGLTSLYSKLSELDAVREAAFNEQQEAYVKEQTELLGTNAEARIKNVTDWVNAQGGEGASDKLNLMAAGAEGLAIIENIMKRSQNVGTPAHTPATEGVTLEKVNAMQFAKDEYGNLKMDNPTYAAKVREMRASLKR